MKHLMGVVTAIPTPLLPNEDVDPDGLRRLIDMVIQEGAAGVFILGSMGEGAALLDEQKILVAKTAARHIKGSVPLLVSISEVSTRRTLHMGLKLQDVGADYLVSTGPFYYRFPNSRSIMEFFGSLSEGLSIPLVFYHQPGFTGNSFDVDTIQRVVNLPNVAALKDSSCNFQLVSEILRRYPDKASRPFSLLQGDESLFDITLLLGADGVVTGGGVLFVRILVELYEAAVRQDKLAAFELQTRFRNGLMKVIGPNLMTDWMAAIKYQLKLKGICDDVCTGPFMNRFSERDVPTGEVQPKASAAQLTT